DTAVITIAGLCDNPPADKSSAADCKTVITRAQFEVILSSVAPNMPAAQRRRFASSYVNALVMAKNAEKEGLDKGANYEEQMKLMRVRVLAQEMNRAIQTKAAEIPDKDIEENYNANLPKFEEADIERIYVPRNQQPPTTVNGKKLTEAEQQ